MEFLHSAFSVGKAFKRLLRSRGPPLDEPRWGVTLPKPRQHAVLHKALIGPNNRTISHFRPRATSKIELLCNTQCYRGLGEANSNSSNPQGSQSLPEFEFPQAGVQGGKRAPLTGFFRVPPQK